MGGRQCVCLVCCQAVVTDVADRALLWERVLEFFEGPLGLLAWGGVWRGMWVV